MPTTEPIETGLEAALARLRREGGPVPVGLGSRREAVLLTPEELERLEDERDAAILRVAMIEDRDEPLTALADVA